MCQRFPHRDVTSDVGKQAEVRHSCSGGTVSSWVWSAWSERSLRASRQVMELNLGHLVVGGAAQRVLKPGFVYSTSAWVLRELGAGSVRSTAPTGVTPRPFMGLSDPRLDRRLRSYHCALCPRRCPAQAAYRSRGHAALLPSALQQHV